MTLLKNKKVAIVGGGPGGLTLARLLQLSGADVKVYERDKDRWVRQQGATLDLHYESGLKALKACGLMEAFKKFYRPGAERYTVTDNHAIVHYTERDEAPLEDFNSLVNDKSARPEIDRGPLRDLLVESLHVDTVVWDSKFLRLEAKGEGWTLVFENGTSAYADLVIGVDGAHSKVRKYLSGIRSIYSGVTIVEGNIYNAAENAPHLWELTGGGKVYALWDKKTIFLSTKGEGSLSFYITTKEPENWERLSGIDFKNKEQVFEWFGQRFSDWGEVWKELFASDAIWFVPRPQYYFPADQSWESLPNLTMLGDAAHVMPPSGDGVNQAMLDALELYEALCLGNFSTVQEAIASFEKSMLARTSEEVEKTLVMTEALLSEGNLQYMVDFFNGAK